MDGTDNQLGEVTKEVWMKIHHKDYDKTHRLLVADIGEDNIILGYPFFKATNLLIDWLTGKMRGTITLMETRPLANEPSSSWHKTAQTHMTTTWPNEPHVLVASEAHSPRTQLSHAHICSSFLYNVFLHPELYNNFFILHIF
jgi:hypothetical protein